MKFPAAVIISLTLLLPRSSPTPLVDLPWGDLESALVGESVILQDTSPDDYVAQCYPEFRDNAAEERTHHNLIDQPSGLCMNQLFCGFDECNPMANNETMPVSERMSILNLWDTLPTLPPEVDLLLAAFLDPNNPNYNLPPKVLFPKVAGDVVAAVNFARKHKIQLSVKNSGHSYTGASSKKDTLHINMNQYTQYAPNGLLVCNNASTSADSDDLAHQPCKLAEARGKPAVLRVSGGENFDKVYRAVHDYNDAQESYKYHLVGGAAGTVSPMGWTWQGGLSGTTAGRLYGFGVDQVLQIEMVLPNGHHVRFGPTEWVEDSEYVYPRTSKVSGVCHQNPEEVDESRWTWGQCEDDIPFDDLWFAVNGGGGGTYGIVTSVYLQLHDYRPVSLVNFGPAVLYECGLPLLDPNYTPAGSIVAAHWSFIIDFYHQPEVLGVSRELSSSCAAPALLPFQLSHFCYGENATDSFATAWKNYVYSLTETLTAAGMSQSDINLAAECVINSNNFTSSGDFPDYASMITMGPDEPTPGKARDSPMPSYASTSESSVNLLIPKAFLVSNKEEVAELLTQSPVSSYWAFGAGTSTAQDQSVSLTPGYRQAGTMLFISMEALDENFWSNLFPRMYNTSGTNFPAFVGSNHAGPNTRGPLKSDWTKPCPLEWTTAERDEKCIPLQEAIWGTEVLKRLESIKSAIDPDFMLDCYGCVGNNKSQEANVTSQDTDAGISSFRMELYVFLLATLTTWFLNL